MKQTLEELITKLRNEALAELDGTMLRAFDVIGEWMCNEASSSELKKNGICGFTQNSLRMIMEHHEAGDMSEWLLGDRYYRNLVDFLGLNAMRIDDVHRRFPKAYEKWSEEEDCILLEEFASGASLSSLSGKHGRNVHAIRLRLMKLGAM